MALDELIYMHSMTPEQRMLFTSEMGNVRKSAATGVVLALFLGGLGAHQFYIGRIGLGALYAVFCWTLIPALVGLVEAFLMPERVARYNDHQAQEIAAKVKMLDTPRL